MDEFQIRGFGDGEGLGALPTDVTTDAPLARCASAFPTERKASRASWASQLYRLMNEVKEGDDVVCADGAGGALCSGESSRAASGSPTRRVTGGIRGA